MKVGEISSWLTRHTALEPTLLQGVAFEHVVAARVRQCGCADLGAYAALLKSSPAELEQLITAVAVSETWFFRYPQSYALLADYLRQRVARQTDGRPLRMLSVPCSTGEEACSMAITALHAGWPADRVVVEALDIGGERIRAARSGVYNANALRGGSPDWARQWLSMSGSDLRVAPEVLDAIVYHQQNVLDIPATHGDPPFDVIFCRNLLIYLHAAARKRLIALLTARLDHHGLLFVGHTEQPSLLSENFQPVDAPASFAVRLARDGSPQPVQSPVRKRRRVSDTRDQTVTPTRGSPRATTLSALPQPAPALPAPPSLAIARDLADRGKLDEALQAAQAVMASDGPNVAVLELIGNVQLALGRTTDARDAFQKVVYLDPDCTEALLQLGLIHERLSQPEQAQRYRERAARLHRNGRDES